MVLTIVLLLIIAAEIWGITSVKKEHLLKSMIYYTQLSNAAALLSAVLLSFFIPTVSPLSPRESPRVPR